MGMVDGQGPSSTLKLELEPQCDRMLGRLIVSAVRVQYLLNSIAIFIPLQFTPKHVLKVLF